MDNSSCSLLVLDSRNLEDKSLDQPIFPDSKYHSYMAEDILKLLGRNIPRGN